MDPLKNLERCNFRLNKQETNIVQQTTTVFAGRTESKRNTVVKNSVVKNFEKKQLVTKSLKTCELSET